MCLPFRSFSLSLQVPIVTGAEVFTQRRRHSIEVCHTSPSVLFFFICLSTSASLRSSFVNLRPIFLFSDMIPSSKRLLARSTTSITLLNRSLVLGLRKIRALDIRYFLFSLLKNTRYDLQR